MAKSEARALAAECTNALRVILADSAASASAKVGAARTLLEMSGRIGKHQPKPDNTVARPSDMSLAEIDAELSVSRGVSRKSARDTDDDIF